MTLSDEVILADPVEWDFHDAMAWNAKTQKDEKVVEGKWYHWSETWADLYGPFDNRQQAIAALKEYGASL